MAEHALTGVAILQWLENETILAEAHAFAEFALLGEKPEILLSGVRKHAQYAVEDSALSKLYQRIPRGELRTAAVKLTLDPPTGKRLWTAPLEGRFDAVWSQIESMYVAHVPVLAVSAVGRSREAALSKIADEIRAALKRKGALSSLRKLLGFQRAQRTELQPFEYSAKLKTPREQAREEKTGSAAKPVLDEAGDDLLKRTLPEAFFVERHIARLAETLGGAEPRSVLLVGASGVGKTAIFHELVRRRHQFSLGHTPFWSTSGSRLIAGLCGFGMWQERCRRLVREASKEKPIIHFGSLIELMDVGKSEHQAQGIAGYLRAHFETGELLGIVEALPEQIALIERSDSQLLRAFERIDIAPSDAETTRLILESRAEVLARLGRFTWAVGTLDELDRLHRRFATYSAFPGRPLRFLEHLASSARSAASAPSREINAADVTLAFSRQTGLPQFMLDDDVALDLAAARKFFDERVLFQPDATQLVLDVLATVKAVLNRPRRPIASLLFIGPTGVGKTEMAKTLAEFLFSSPDRMTRFDMGEFTDAAAVSRLIGQGKNGEGLLTAKVREQPFAVLLFDEFEKADPSFFDLLLQVLGEARLSDAQGRVADFTNSVIVLTSNLGAESFQRGRAGLTREKGRSDSRPSAEYARAHFLHEVQQFLRPEAYNRIDSVVPFMPLSAAAIRGIADRAIARIRRRDGMMGRGVDLKIAPDALEKLAEIGFDPLYGARPLNRALERELSGPLSDALNGSSHEWALEADLVLKDGALHVNARAAKDEMGRLLRAADSPCGDAAYLRRATLVRRKLQRLERSPVTYELRSELGRLQRKSAFGIKRGGKRQIDPTFDKRRMERLEEALNGLSEFETTVNDTEERAVLAWHQQDSAAERDLGVLVAMHETRLAEVLRRLYSLQFEKPDRITLALFSDKRDFLSLLSRAYLAFARETNMELTLYCFIAGSAEKENEDGAKLAHMLTREERERIEADRKWHEAVKGRSITRELIAAPENWQGSVAGNAVGLAIEFRGQDAWARLGTEEGIHVLNVSAKTKWTCLVAIASERAIEYVPPVGVERLGEWTGEQRRVYAPGLIVTLDKFLKPERYFAGMNLSKAIEAYFDQKASELVED